jgi:Tol biopolymer transport system component
MRTFRARALISITTVALSGVVVSTPAAQAAVDNHISLVSVATPEVFPDANGSFTRAISDDGRFVLFASSQPNVVVGDEADPAGRYLYLRDLQSGTTTRLSHGPGGYLMGNAAISADGGQVAFASDEGDGQSALRLYDRAAGTTTVISAPPAADDHWYTVAISDDARYVFYTRTESAGDAYETKLYRYAVQTGVTDRPVPGKLGSLQNPNYGTIPSSSADGRYLTFVQALDPAAEYSRYRLMRLDTSTGTKTVIGKSAQAEGIPQNAFGDPSMSNDGRYITYTKAVPGSSVHVYVYDAVAGTSKLVSHKAASPGTKANASAYQPQISGDGRYITFSSSATNIVAGVPAVETVFVYDRQSGTAEAFVKNLQGVYPGSAGGYSSLPYIDGDGSTVAFTSRAQNLSAGASNRLERAYAWHRP